MRTNRDHDLLAYLVDETLTQRLSGQAGRWATTFSLAAALGESEPTVRRNLSGLADRGWVTECDEPLSMREPGQRGRPRRYWGISMSGRGVLRAMDAGETDLKALEKVARWSPKATSPKPSAPVREPVPKPAVPAAAPKRDPEVMLLWALYEAAEDYLEVAEPELNAEYDVLVKVVTALREHKGRE